jgi:hypothetical protein
LFINNIAEPGNVDTIINLHNGRSGLAPPQYWKEHPQKAFISSALHLVDGAAAIPL